MTTYLLDTNVITELEDRNKPGFGPIAARLSKLADSDEVCISILSAYEYQHGMAKAPDEMRESLREAWNDFQEQFLILPLSLDSAEVYGKLRVQYEEHTGAGRRKLHEHTIDLMLAASALEKGAVIVTDDRVFETVQEFSPSLQVENWIAEEQPAGTLPVDGAEPSDSVQ